MREAVALLSVLDLSSGRPEPLHRQIYDALRKAILEGRLRPGARLPASRLLAEDLGVSRNTVTAAFEQLAAEGYVAARVGSGTRVSRLSPEVHLHAERKGAGARPPSGVKAPPAELSLRGRALAAIRRSKHTGPIAFQPGVPALAEFPFPLWARLLSRRARHTRADSMGYSLTAGFPPLRKAIAAYLGAARGVLCEHEQVIVVGGTQAALDLATRMLLDPGDPVWIEEPGYLGARAALTAAGAELVPVPVDEEGLDVAAAERARPAARLAYVTPSQQFPLGCTMSLSRRLEMIEWAAREAAWILEDDYDSEFRYAGRPLAALHGLDRHGRVVYAGTFSKTMFPALRVGYLVVPKALVESFTTALRNTGHAAPIAVQAALADFIGEGHFGSHVRRMRALYAERGATLVELLRRDLAGALAIPDATGGMQIACELREHGDDVAICGRAATRAVSASALSQSALTPEPRRGLHLGFAAVPVGREMQDAVARLTAAVLDDRPEDRPVPSRVAPIRKG
jgi:GntR family transcriptional regulator/MocR family aminotransferase